MTSAVFTIKFSGKDEEEFFSFWVGSDCHEDRIIPLIEKFCKETDEYTLKNKGRLNWTYMASNLMRYIAESYEHKETVDLNRVCVITPKYKDSWVRDAIMEYTITPHTDKYSDYRVPLKEALKIEVK